MALIIDLIYVFRELIKLVFVVITSPFGLVGSLLMLGSNY
ncbi:hypothetical protein LP43_1351 [Methylophaga thiooxydans]|uniref:Uncharacterized protein n=1 Tax=Methylophaga thiooxydans TaxID=392484 RepID=A0A0A0BE98_9GAMM|nr:hypothetical protein LP43_1351 [Methylophaga thiooxydans]